MIYFLIIFLYCTIISNTKNTAVNNKVKTIYKDISQGVSLYTQYYKQNTQCDECEFLINTTYRFERTNNSKEIGKVLFNTSNEKLLFQGNNLTNDIRDSNGLVSEYFGFGADCNASLSIKPTITNSILDLQFNAHGKSFWASCNVPLVYSRRTIIKDCEKNTNGNFGTQNLEDFSQALFFTPPSNNGWNTIADRPINKKNNYKLARSIDKGAVAAFFLEFDGPIADNNTNSFDSSTEFSDIVYYLIDDSNEIIEDNAIANISVNCANLDTDFNVDLVNGNQNAYPFLNQEFGFGYFQSGFINSITGSYEEVTNSVGKGNVFTNTTINGQNLNNVWQNVLDDYNMSLQINQMQVNNAKTLKEGLSGQISCGDYEKRELNNFYFAQENDIFKDACGISDINCNIGYNFYCSPKYRVGMYFKTILPTGTEIDKNYFQYTFSPIIGNGGHFELGAGINGQFNFYETDTTTFSCNIDGYFTHGFEKKQFRSCDDTDKPMSRYATIKKLSYDPTVSNLLSGDKYGYISVLKAFGDICADNIGVSIPIQGEAIIDFNFKKNNWGCGIGYNFLGSDKEKINIYNKKKFSDNPKTGDIFYGYHMLSCTTSICFVPTTDNQAENTISTFYPPGSTTPGTYIQAKKNGQVVKDKNGSAYLYGESQQATDNDVLKLPLMNDTCISERLLIHKIFTHAEYYFKDSIWEPVLKIFGSIGIADIKNNVSISRWDLGCTVGFVF